MKARELRELKAEELAQRTRETAQELGDLRVRQRAGTHRPLRMRTLRRERARMLTIAREREAGK
jgi:ribosomal protein L29